MSDVVEAMARAAHDANPCGFRPWDDLARASAEGSTFAAVVMEAQRNAIRAAIRACHAAGGLVVGKMPGEQPEPDEARDWLDKSYAAQQWRRALARGHNTALAAARAAAVEVE